ncbi:MAG: hypothetical protein HY884_06680 [Deltaproteobacteria bacterium]|nr:hypothetical protein [Deltaproteobacteria bacterium]
MTGYLKNQKGASVVAVALMLAVITSIGIVFVSLLSTGVEISVTELNSARALYIAEAGAEVAAAKFKNDWLWKDGYSAKQIGPALWGGSFDLEPLQGDMYPSQTSASPYCIAFTSEMVNTAAKPARTVLVRLAWDPAVNPANLGLELYNSDVSASCAAPAPAPVAASQTANNPEILRYKIPEPGSFPTTVTYTVRVTGNAGNAHSLSIIHPDMPGFSTADVYRALIVLGKSGDSRRETVITVRRLPSC